MEKKRILLLAADARSREILPGALRNQAPDLAVEVSGLIGDVLCRLSQERFESAVCCVDSPDDLAYVLRIKKRHPDFPVVLLSRVPEPGFEILAESMGASAVVRKTSGLEATAKSLALALEAQALAREHRKHLSRTKELSREIRNLCQSNRRLVEMALGLAGGEGRAFTALYVEDDPDQAFILARALERAQLPPLLRSVSSVKKAREYLAGIGHYQNRKAYPFPALVLSDLHLPGGSGLDLVRWMRERDETRFLGVIMFTSSDREEDVEAAYEKGANLYLVKRMDTREVVGVIREIFAQFIAQRSGFGTL